MKQKKTDETKESKQVKVNGDESAKLREELSQLQKERDELFAQLQRVSADYANFQKRAPKQISDTVTYEKEKIFRTLLPALDNFEHTLASADSAETVEVLVKGIAIVYDQMLDILRSHEVEQIEALGEKFDPAFHQAMMQRAESDEEDGVILEEFQKGYRLNGRVIRPSRVVVNKLTDEGAESEEAAEQNEEPGEQVSGESGPGGEEE